MVVITRVRAAVFVKTKIFAKLNPEERSYCWHLTGRTEFVPACGARWNSVDPVAAGMVDVHGTSLPAESTSSSQTDTVIVSGGKRERRAEAKKKERMNSNDNK